MTRRICVQEARYIHLVAYLRHACFFHTLRHPTLRDFVACEGLIGCRVFDTGRVCASLYVSYTCAIELEKVSCLRHVCVACTSSYLGLVSCLCGYRVFDTQLIQAGFLGFRVFDVRRDICCDVCCVISTLMRAESTISY